MSVTKILGIFYKLSEFIFILLYFVSHPSAIIFKIIKGGEFKMTEQEKIEFFRKIYEALSVLSEEKPQIATPAIASLRVLLIYTFGEEKQKELIRQWNEKESHRIV